MGNKCGDCAMCCSLLGIVELKKPRGAACLHCPTGKSCAIYDHRPQSCQDFECLWLSGAWHDDFKPTRIGGFFWAPRDPAVFDGVQCEVEPGKAWRGGVIEMLARNIASRGHHVMVRCGNERIFFQGKDKPMPEFIERAVAA